MNKILLLCLCLFSVTAALAQEQSDVPPLETDRPSVGDAAKIVLPGYFQVETGVKFQRDETYGLTDKQVDFAETTLRIGVLKMAELRVRGQLTHQKTVFRTSPLPENPIKNTGLNDIMIGTKIQLLKNQGARPDLALQADFRLPIGDKEFKGDKVAPKLRLNFRNKLSEKFSLSYNLGVEFEEEETPESDKTFEHVGLYTLGMSYKITDSFKVFLEAFGEMHQNDMEQSFDGGFADKLKENVQLDAYAGFGVSEEAPDFFGSAGISFRLPR